METAIIQQIFKATTIEDKLTALNINCDWDSDFQVENDAENPGIIISTKNPQKLKFPSFEKLEQDEFKAIALHFFANHELQAINMMCAILLKIPHNTTALLRFKRGVYKSLIDEQKHFKLYINRMKNWGLDFGHYNQSDFFWRQMEKIHTPEQFNATMALTLENANLDFSWHYEKFFRNIGDSKTADILKTVLEDEIDHVRIGYKWLSHNFPEKDMWDLYQQILPFPLTASRAKGKHFNLDARIRAGIDTHFISSLKNHKDSFQVVNRKEWKM